MRLLICNSKNWFVLNQSIRNSHTVKEISKKEELSLELLETFCPDFVLFPHWNWIVKREIHNHFNCVVFHTAPLPYGRGGSPIQNLIMRGHKISPVCALKMSDGVDDGPIYCKQTISLEGQLSEIFQRLNSAVNVLISRLIYTPLEPVEQVGEVVTFKRLKTADNEIAPNSNIQEIFDKIRMLDDVTYPSAYINLDNVLMEFFEIKKESNEMLCKVRITDKGKK